MSLLLNPQKYESPQVDFQSKVLMEKTIRFFEDKGLESIKEDDQASRWYTDFLKFIKKEAIFATLLTPTGYGAPGSRFDLSRVCEFNEISAFYSLSFQYTYQVSILGLGPIWMGDNEKAKHLTAEKLKEGGIFAFGLSEKTHGADLYSNEMALSQTSDGNYLANGGKYYIGNANKAALISTFARYKDTQDYVFFVVDSQHRNYKLIKKISTSGVRAAYVGDYELIEYPITPDDILSSGPLAWDSALSSVNIGKFQLGFASVGICTHAYYEALNHASNRELYGKKVTDFPHIQKIFTESYARLIAMKLYALRSLDYFRSATDADRRYLLFNPIQKMKVTTQGMKIIEMLLDAIAAKGFEQDTYFETAIRDIGMIPRLEGTTHVNIALVIKFINNYFFNPVEYPVIPKRDDPADDSYLFRQKAGKLASVRFPDYHLAYEGVQTPNVMIFKEQVELFRSFLEQASPNPEQMKNIDYMLALGEMFTLIVYAQLILENSKLHPISSALLDEIFNFLVRDFAQYALTQISNYNNSAQQEEFLKSMMKKPYLNQATVQTLWENEVKPLVGCYQNY
ncbi:acyl-CoA dehydrogenase [Desulfosporosinus metallidurans]|uniref:Acyl-CoA dehydrogenase n=1 Tax=Desulfosporosinus metallidurans TaxID=1888891 RepID=A0A1Q8QUE7_9FIRM|nr:acyl-CoA dehydrogenase [Desulfosporosinus metallidurans]OLN30979.1 Acyl-CoA dehydrogenase [Desulfosporosinus metallidurans]